MIIQHIQSLVALHPHYSAIILISAKILGALTLFPGTPLTLLAGATFGFALGSFVSLIGNVLGATAAFLVSRFVLRDYVTKNILLKYPTIEKYEKRFLSRGLKTVILLRLIPLFPFNVLNYLLGVTQVSTKEYIIGTTIGIIPGTLVFVYFGESLRMLSIFHVVVSVVALIGLIYVGKHYEKN
jgi:uncharacterized membrane protein YdjX (TVP38/TMEM64 family)